MSKKVVTLYLNEEPYQTLKKIAPALGKSVSELVDGWIKEGLMDLTGEDFKVSPEIDYKTLKKAHSKLVYEVERLERWLRRRKVLKDLEHLIRQLGLKSEDAHTFITYLEVIAEKKAIEGKLTLFRSGPENLACAPHDRRARGKEAERARRRKGETYIV